MSGYMTDQAVAERVLRHIDDGTTDRGDAVWREPVANYRSRERLDAERPSGGGSPGGGPGGGGEEAGLDSKPLVVMCGVGMSRFEAPEGLRSGRVGFES